MPGVCPLSEAQSRALLRFCRNAGAAVFTVNFLYVEGEDSEQTSANFYRRLSAFSGGGRVLENIYGNDFRRQECWVLSDESIEAILTETHGDLFAYDILHSPEDWLFYTGDTILLQIVSHEHEATLRLSDDQYALFQQISISHRHGNPQWSELPTEPFRTSRAP